MASPSSISSISSSSSSTWYSSSSEEDAIMHNMFMNAAQVFMAGDEASSQRLTRRAKLNRDQEASHDKLVADYFSDEPVYTAEIFRRRFRMSRPLFLRIAGDIAQSYPFFTLRNEYTHHNLQADLVEYIWNNAQNEPDDDMEDED
ncbi:hypothetical protein HanIR_Chr05g0242081 [Helianthus annuus]|nr:hypothetical protein HanIR_Chr05g0242081 [Helianthus annuus]